MTDPFGSLFTIADVRDGIEAHLQTWQETYLAWAERQTGRDPRDLPLVKAWEKPNEVRKWPESQLPALLIIVQGTTEPPAMTGEGIYSATYLAEVIAICSANNEQNSRDLASAYASAFAGAMLQLPGLSDMADAVEWRAMATNRLPDTDEDRTLAAEGNSFAVTVTGVLNAYAGVSEPPEDPYDPPEFPTIEETQVEVSKQ